MERKDHERVVQLNDLFDRLTEIDDHLTVVGVAAVNPGLDIGESIYTVLNRASRDVCEVRGVIEAMAEEMKGEATVELRAS